MMTTIEQVTGWSVLGVGVLAAVYGLVKTIAARPPGEKPKLARGFFVWPNTLSAILVVLAVGGIVFSGRVPHDWVAGIAGALALGWILLLLLFFGSRAAGRKLATEAAGADQIGLGYRLLSASGFCFCSAALLGAGIILSAVLATIAQDTPVVEMLLAVGLGSWLAAAFWSLPSAIYRGLLAQETDAEPAQVASLCVQFRSAPGEMAFLAAVALAVSVAMGRYHFGGEDVSALLYPLGAFAASVLFGMLASPLLAPASARVRRHAALRWLGIAVFLAGTGLAAYFLEGHSFVSIQAFYCFGVGLATAMILILTARYRPPFMPLGSPFGMEIAIAQALMVLASAVLAFRWLAGYGVSLCAVGLFSSFAVVLPVGTLWAAGRAGEDSEGETDLPFMAHAASRFAEIMMAGGAFLVVVVLVRLFAERAELGRAGIDITDPYPLIGLVIGASFPIVLRSLAQSGRINLTAASFDRAILSRLGRWAAFRTLGIMVLAGVTPLLVAFFWRTQAAGAFLVGLAAAELFLILTLWLGEARNTADEGVRLATRSIHVLAVGSGLVTALLGPPLIELTGTLSRAAKIRGLVAVFAVLFVWVLVVVWTRARAEH